jgi:2-methylcitrate dehydratase PrpD
VALGEALGRSLGEVLKALLQGYELGARFGEAYRVPEGEHVDGTWGTVAASVAASALLNLSPQQRDGAMNAALAQMSRSLYLPVGEGAMSRLLHPGLAASRGMDLSLAAAAGFAGPDGLDRDPVLQSLWRLPPDLQLRPGCAVEAGYVKLLPGARHLHYAATAALRWRERQQASEPDRVLRLCQQSGAIRLGTYREACTYCDQPNPRNRIQAQFSLQFAVAATLLWGELGPDLFQEEHLSNPMLRNLLGRIVIEADDEHPGRWAELRVCLPDSTEVRELVIGLPGDPHLPITESERLSKARRLMEPALGPERTEQVLQHWLEAGLDRALLP